MAARRSRTVAVTAWAGAGLLGSGDATTSILVLAGLLVALVALLTGIAIFGRAAPSSRALYIIHLFALGMNRPGDPSSD